MQVTKKDITFNVVPTPKVTENFWETQFSDWENETFEFISKFLNKEKIFIDIGSWVGPISLFASYHSKSCLAFEPDIVAYTELEKNIKINNIKNIFTEFRSVSIYDKISLGALFLGHSCTSSLDTRNTFTSQAVSIDYILLKYNLSESNISVIKIDIEGHEEELLKDETLMNLNVPMYISFHPGWAHNREQYYSNITPFLIKKGFDIDIVKTFGDFFELKIN
jgi:FkbM family methyltransferase